MADIYVLGSLNMDLVMDTDVIPKRGETIKGNSFFTNPGGKGANQAVAARKLDGTVYMAGAVGDDLFGKEMLLNLERLGIDISHIRTVSNRESGIAIIIVENNDNRIILDSGANSNVDYNDVDAFIGNAKEGDIFVTQLENEIDVIGYALKCAKSKGMFTILNPAPVNKAIIPYLQYVDLLTPNRGECAMLTGIEEYSVAAKSLNIANVVITLGGDGYYYFGEFGEIKGHCIKVNPIDTTAAGDTFCGALATRLAFGDNMSDALKYASCAASLACTKRGAQQSVPTKADVEKVLQL